MNEGRLIRVVVQNQTNRIVRQNGHEHSLRPGGCFVPALLGVAARHGEPTDPRIAAPDCALFPPPRPRTFRVGFDALAEGLVKRLSLRAARRFYLAFR